MNSNRPRDIGTWQQTLREEISKPLVRPSWLGNGVALLCAAVAILIRWLLDPLLGGHLHLLTLYGGVAVAVWFGGWRPGVLAAFIGFAAVDYLFMPPRFELKLDSTVLATFAGYSVSCGLIIFFGELMRRT